MSDCGDCDCGDCDCGDCDCGDCDCGDCDCDCGTCDCEDCDCCSCDCCSCNCSDCTCIGYEYHAWQRFWQCICCCTDASSELRQPTSNYSNNAPNNHPVPIANYTPIVDQPRTTNGAAPTSQNKKEKEKETGEDSLLPPSYAEAVASAPPEQLNEKS